MFIKKLILDNVQKHEHLEIEFSPDVNVIYGATASGKSCIIRAIQFLFYPNELRGDTIRKNDTKKTSVKAELDNGVIIERIKTSTTNTYKITVGNETKEYNAIGKGLPDEVYQILKVKAIEIDNDNLLLNVANQFGGFFLFDKSPTFRTKLFNKLTGNDIIDNVMQSFNKDLLQISREEKSELEHLKDLQLSQERLKKDKENLAKIYDNFSKIYNYTKNCIEQYDKLNDYSQKVNKIDNELEDVNYRLKTIPIIDYNFLNELFQKITKFDYLVKQYSHLQEIKEEILDVDNQLAKILLPKINLNDLRKKIERLSYFMEQKKKLEQIDSDKEKTILTLNTVVSQLNTEDKNYRELLKKIKVCPICKRILTTELIGEIKL